MDGHARPRSLSRYGRIFAFLVAAVLIAEIDLGGSCGCDDKWSVSSIAPVTRSVVR